jgi:UDP-sulfoquinovose synthase
MRILVLGGDGYLGWPTAMHLSAHGHEVTVVDNYLRRRLMAEVGVVPLFDVPDLNERTRRWQEQSGKEIRVHIGDLNDWNTVARIFEETRPESIVHYAEQPSAPYSMMGRKEGILTLGNNLIVTANLIHAVHEFCPEAHIVKLGTMGEYGTPNIDIEEGWLDIEHNGRSDRFLFPRQAGSLYHTTKIMDTDLMWFYVRTWGLRATDLMQGPVYGLVTEETEDPALWPYFNYDELFGTVINRFIVQAVCGYPLTVYGKGGQTRGYLNILDTLNCVRLCVENPAGPGELRVFNQFVDQFDVQTLAERVAAVGAGFSLDVTIDHIKNPRVEQEEHYYNAKALGLRALGLEPHPLADEVLAGLIEAVLPYRESIRKEQIFRGYKWK